MCRHAQAPRRGRMESAMVFEGRYSGDHQMVEVRCASSMRPSVWLVIATAQIESTRTVAISLCLNSSGRNQPAARLIVDAERAITLASFQLADGRLTA